VGGADRTGTGGVGGGLVALTAARMHDSSEMEGVRAWRSWSSSRSAAGVPAIPELHGIVVLRLLHLEEVRLVRTIAHRELRNNSSAVLRAVQAGESIEISNHGEVVAVLVPPGRRSSESLRVRGATVKGGFSTLCRAHLGRPVQESLDDLRGER
jgi:prevent-host-death family protein